MVLLLIILLAISIVGMFTLLGVKHYELSTGHMFFAQSRPRISKWVARQVFLFGTAIPLFLRWQLGRAYKTLSAFFQKQLARTIVKAEHLLESVLHRVRKTTEAPRAPGEASPFLREVGEYKKKLSESSDRAEIEKL